jgi:hypothetical protein
VDTTRARSLGLVIAALAVGLAGLLAFPLNASDLHHGSVYPLFLVPVPAIITAAGLIAMCRPAVASAAALPWGAGLAAAGVLASRRVALWTVAGSALVTCACLAIGTVHGFGLRLPD